MGHPCKFQRVSRLRSVTARHSSSGRQPNFASLNRGRHLYSTGRPSRWALSHISSLHLHYITDVERELGLLQFSGDSLGLCASRFYISAQPLNGRRQFVHFAPQPRFLFGLGSSLLLRNISLSASFAHSDNVFRSLPNSIGDLICLGLHQRQNN